MKKTNLYLTEAYHLHATMSPREQKLKEDLIDLLKYGSNGKGGHHAKYATLLENFFINIVPLKDDPDFTAAISYDDGIIFIGDGLLNDEKLFFQLSVVMRHELLHNMLKHQIRMMYHIGEQGYLHLKYSQSIHEIINIVADFEISDGGRYTEEDKDIVRNLTINGKVVGGLILEDKRPDWLSLPVEEMYNRACSELQTEFNNLKTMAGAKKFIQDETAKPENKQNQFGQAYINATKYARNNENAVASFKAPLSKIKASKLYKRWCDPDVAPFYKEIFDTIYSTVYEQKWWTDTDLKEFIHKINTSAPLQSIVLKNPTTNKKIIELYSPEEKDFTIELLNNILMYMNPYSEWYKKVKDLFAEHGELTKQDAQTILTGIGG